MVIIEGWCDWITSGNAKHKAAQQRGKGTSVKKLSWSSTLEASQLSLVSLKLFIVFIYYSHIVLKKRKKKKRLVL